MIFVLSPAKALDYESPLATPASPSPNTSPTPPS
jgi:cytoplasmic iron level regulating protein YaaA (DUF328/UPF0246 family)